MNFYRLAKAEDFEVRLYEFDLPLEVIALIEENKTKQAILKLRVLKGIGLEQSKRFCYKYEAFIRVREDFKKGLPVYTDY